MRKAYFAVALAASLTAACGGHDDSSAQTLDGSWSIAISDWCSSGTMTINGPSDSLTGTWSCPSLSKTGTIAGSLKGTSVSLTYAESNFKPILITGTLSGNAINGTCSGSGFTGQEAFTAVRQ